MITDDRKGSMIDSVLIARQKITEKIAHAPQNMVHEPEHSTQNQPSDGLGGRPVVDRGRRPHNKSEGSSTPPGSIRHACVTWGAISRRSCDTMSTGRSCFNLPARCYQQWCHSRQHNIPRSCATSPRALQSSPASGSSRSSSCGCRHSCTANATRLLRTYDDRNRKRAPSREAVNLPLVSVRQGVQRGIQRHVQQADRLQHIGGHHLPGIGVAGVATRPSHGDLLGEGAPDKVALGKLKHQTHCLLALLTPHGWCAVMHRDHMVCHDAARRT